MRLIELKEKVRNTRIPTAIFYDLVAVEVDTVGPDSPQEKIELADQMQRAQPSGTVVKVPLSKETQHYLLYKGLPNLFDIAKDNMDRRKMHSIQKFQARLHAKLVGIE
jgi:hypothetical protein